MYYRLGNKTENIFLTASVEIAMELGCFKDKNELLEMLGAETPEDAETESLFWDDDGFFGAGLYYPGVCCCDSLESLASYFNVSVLGTDHLVGSVIFEFEGDWVDSCNDGDVVNPTKIIAVHDVAILEQYNE